MAEKRLSNQDKLVERINALDYQNLCTAYSTLPGLVSTTRDEIRDRFNQNNILLRFVYSRDLTSAYPNVLTSCLKLIRQTSHKDYQASEIKWSDSKKRAEMLLPDMRYLLVIDPSSSVQDVDVLGFLSYMATYEDGCQVVYIYEVHVRPELQGKGLGRRLMELTEQIAELFGLEKCMLTVFNSNKHALKWYAQLGYVKDDFSPGPRVLRSGRVKMPSYTILSKIAEPNDIKNNPSPTPTTSHE